jgi:RecJ-like exonuclease
MLEQIKTAISKIDELSRTKPIRIISHYDTDGITSAAIFSRAMQRWNKTFSLSITKELSEEYIKSLPENNILIFLDLASNSLHHLKNKKTDIFIFDHHEIITKEIPQNIRIISPFLANSEVIATSGICYLFAKTLSQRNKDLANLAIIGMIGDILEKEINKTYDSILKDAESSVKRGLLLYPSTRPIDKVLEYSSNPYIPGVTGSFIGVSKLLQEANIKKDNGRYKSIYEMTDAEMSSLITAVMLRCIGKNRTDNIIGNIFLVKWFNKLEDAREISAAINACSRMDFPEIALKFCLNNNGAKQQAEKIYVEYKQHIISALKHIEESEKITGNKYTIINARDKIKDTIIGTVTSIISHSPIYEEGTIIVGLAYNENKIKVSARIAGREGRNLREVLHKVVMHLGGEVGGHPNAAGCMIEKDKESLFIEELKKVLEVELVKV